MLSIYIYAMFIQDMLCDYTRCLSIHTSTISGNVIKFYIIPHDKLLALQ